MEGVKENEWFRKLSTMLYTVLIFSKILASELIKGVYELSLVIKKFLRCLLVHMNNSFKTATRQKRQKQDLPPKKTFKERMEHVWPVLQICNRETRIAADYIAKGMGLMAGYEGRQARFNVFHLRGGNPGGVRAEVWSADGPLPIERRLHTDRLEISFVPPTPGIYTVILTSLGRPLPGSPFTVKVDDACYAPPFSSPFRTPIVTTKIRTGVINFGDEEMLVKEDGSLTPLKPPKHSSDHIRQMCLQKEKHNIDTAPKILHSSINTTNSSTLSQDIQNPARNYTNKYNQRLMNTTKINPEIMIPKPFSRHKFTGFKMGNYVTRQESIESLKCSKNIKKLITKFETSIGDITDKDNEIPRNQFRDCSIAKMEQIIPAIKIIEENQEYLEPDSECIEALPNQPKMVSQNEKPIFSEHDFKMSNYDSDKKTAKVNRSQSLNVYLDRISSLLSSNDRKYVNNVNGNESMNNANINTPLTFTKVYRSTSLYDKPRNPSDEATTNKTKNLQFVGGKHDIGCRKASPENRQSVKQLETKNLVFDGTERINNDVYVNQSPSDSFINYDRIENNSIEYVKSPSVSRKISEYNIKINNKRKIFEPSIETEFQNDPHKCINTLGNIYSPSKSPMSRSFHSLLETFDNASANKTPLKTYRHSVDDLALMSQRNIPLNGISYRYEYSVKDRWRTDDDKKRIITDGISAKDKRNRLISKRDSSSSREDEMLVDITEPNISFDISLSSSSDSENNLPFDHEISASPIIRGDNFHKAQKKPSLSVYFDQVENDIASQQNDLNHLIVSRSKASSNSPTISLMSDSEVYRHRKWNTTNLEAYKPSRAPLSLGSEQQHNYSSSIARSKNIEDLYLPDLKFKNLGTDSNSDSYYSSFMSLNYPNKNNLNFFGKNDSSSKNNVMPDKLSSKVRTISSLSLDEKKLLFCKFNRFCSNIGLKKNTRGSFSLRKENSIKNHDPEKYPKFKLTNKSGVMKKNKDSNQKPNRNRNNYSSYHAVKNASETVNFVGKMKDYWNNINKNFYERSNTNKEKSPKLGPVTPKIVAKNRDRFERMGKVMDKFKEKFGDNESQDSCSEFRRSTKKTSEQQTNTACTFDRSIEGNIPICAAGKPWKLLDFIDKTPKSPFSRRKHPSEKFNGCESGSELKNIFNDYNNKNNNDHYSNYPMKRDFAIFGDKNSIRKFENRKIGKFDKLLNKDALLASLRSFDTESAYLRTLQENNTAGYDVSYPHVPVKSKRELRSNSSFSCKIAPLRSLHPDK